MRGPRLNAKDRQENLVINRKNPVLGGYSEFLHSIACSMLLHLCSCSYLFPYWVLRQPPFWQRRDCSSGGEGMLKVVQNRRSFWMYQICLKCCCCGIQKARVCLRTGRREWQWQEHCSQFTVDIYDTSWHFMMTSRHVWDEVHSCERFTIAVSPVSLLPKTLGMVWTRGVWMGYMNLSSLELKVSELRTSLVEHGARILDFESKLPYVWCVRFGSVWGWRASSRLRLNTSGISHGRSRRWYTSTRRRGTRNDLSGIKETICKQMQTFNVEGMKGNKESYKTYGLGISADGNGSNAIDFIAIGIQVVSELKSMGFNEGARRQTWLVVSIMW